MTIGTYQEFYSIVKDDLPIIARQLADCIDAVKRICACKKSQRQKKSNECNDIYINFIKNNGEGLKEYFATKTLDKTIIFNHSTHHTIFTLTLR